MPSRACNHGDGNAQDEDQIGGEEAFQLHGLRSCKAGVAGKRHGMIKRTTKFIRDASGTMLLSPSDSKIVKKYMPYDR